MRIAAFSVFVACTLCVIMPAPAAAQWYAGVYMGANTTQPATVTVTGDGYDVRFPNVSFEAQPFTSPQYYGWRLGRHVDEARRLGVELEFVHLKVIAKPEDLGPAVTRYQMTHGLNFLVVNLMRRIPLSRSTQGEGRIALTGRGGVGITLPHAETTILGQPREQYEYGGPGAHAALGLNVRLKGRASVTTEYKVTYARPTISMALNGTGRTTTLSHHVALGFAFGLSR